MARGSFAANGQLVSIHKNRAKHQFPRVQHALDSCGDVAAANGRATDVGNVVMEPDLAGGRFAVELLAPAWPPNFVTVTFAVLENLNLFRFTVGSQGDAVINDLRFAESIVKNNHAGELFSVPGKGTAEAGNMHLHVCGAFDCFNLRGVKADNLVFETVGLGEAGLVGLIASEVDLSGEGGGQ